MKNTQPYHNTPFSKYFNILSQIDGNKRYSKEYGSILIIALMEEVGEMARAYLAEHGRKKTNIDAQKDESYEQELGDLLVVILRFARIKKINLDERIMYTLDKIQKRVDKPKDTKILATDNTTKNNKEKVINLQKLKKKQSKLDNDSKKML